MAVHETGKEVIRESRPVLLRLDPAVYEGMQKWAADELRSATSQIEFVLRRALQDAGRLPQHQDPVKRGGRLARNARTPST